MGNRLFKSKMGPTFIAFIANAVSSITVAAPLNTVKLQNTNQNTNFERKSTWCKDLIKIRAQRLFFKGLTTKVLLKSHSLFCIAQFVCFLSADTGYGAKLVFSYTLYTSSIPDTTLLQVHLNQTRDSAIKIPDFCFSTFSIAYPH